MTLDEQILFCEEKANNIKLKTEPQTFVEIGKNLAKLKTQSEELKPCPLCGGKATVRARWEMNVIGLKIWCECTECFARTVGYCSGTRNEKTAIENIENGKAIAIGQWNMRTTIDVKQEAPEMYKEQKKAFEKFKADSRETGLYKMCERIVMWLNKIMQRMEKRNGSKITDDR